MTEHWNGSSRARHAALALIAALAGAPACSTPEQFSYLNGQRWLLAEINTYDTLIVSVDGKSYSFNYNIMVDPGHHQIVFQTTPVDGFPFSPQKALDIDIQPCTRYWFEAKRGNRLQQDFQPRVNYTERIQGCGLAANSGSAATASSSAPY